MFSYAETSIKNSESNQPVYNAMNTSSGKCEKRRAQICNQIQRLIKFLQDYAGRRVRQTRTPNTSAERKFTNLIKLKQYRVKRNVSPSTPTCWRQAPSFRSRRSTISHRETQQTNEQNQKEQSVPSVGLSYVKLCDTAASVH